jgi:hypothetical protein
MKVVDRATFLKLPAGTIYCKGRQWMFENISIKGENSGPNDWNYASPTWVDATDSNDAFDALESMLRDGTSRPCDDSFGRDAMYEADAIFLVYEPDDLRFLKEQIDNALEAAAKAQTD